MMNEVEPDSHGQPKPARRRAAGFKKYPGTFARVDQDIVRPFQRDQSRIHTPSLGRLPDRERRGEGELGGTADAGGERVEPGSEEIAARAYPCAPAPPASRTLRVGADPERTGGKGLAVVCKALDIDKGTFTPIYLLSRRGESGEQVVDPKALSAVMTFFAGVRPADAREVLRSWQRDNAYQEAILALAEDRRVDADRS